MVRRSGPRFVTCLLASLLIPHTPAAALTEVDVALVLAVDISNSMDPEEQALQREGFVAAFRSPFVHEAIRKGALGRVAVDLHGVGRDGHPAGHRSLDGHREFGRGIAVCGSSGGEPRFAVRLAPQSRRPST